MNGIKVMLFGMTLALLGFALYTANLFAVIGALLSVIVGIIGLCIKD